MATLLQAINTYTEVDAGGYLTLDDTRATAASVPRTADAYAYYDGGVNWLNEIDLQFRAFISGGSGAGYYLSGFTVTVVDDANNWGLSDIGVWLDYNSGTPRIRFFRPGGTPQNYTVSLNTVYYCTLTRAAANDGASLLIYSDAQRTSLLATLSITGLGTGTRYRYHYAGASSNDATGSTSFSGYFDFQESVPSPAKFFLFF